MKRPSPYRVVPHMRPLYFHENDLYCSSFDQIWKTSDFGETFNLVGLVEIESRLLRLASYSSLAQRLLRASIYKLRVLSNGNIVLLFKGGTYTLEKGKMVAELTCPVRSGSRPISLDAKPNGPVVFGEYFSNNKREPMNIFVSNDFGKTWDVAYTFGPKEIRHIHGITYDQWEDCFWITTGDDDHECRLIKASPDFKNVETVRKGGQMNRFVSVLATPNNLYMATDTPSETNYIFSYNKEKDEILKLGKIENSNFYNCQVDDQIFMGTVAEPSPVNDSNHHHVWMGNLDSKEWSRVLSFPVDRITKASKIPGIPQGLFQFPRVFFPEGKNPSKTLVCHSLGSKNFEDHMLCFKLSELQPSL